jgi:hypothetical protein
MTAGGADQRRMPMRKAFEHYKPELHYMRGPGPMWVKKHGRAEAITSDRDRTAPTLVEAIARTFAKCSPRHGMRRFRVAV